MFKVETKKLIHQKYIAKWSSIVFIVNFERISYLVLVFLLFTLNI